MVVLGGKYHKWRGGGGGLWLRHDFWSKSYFLFLLLFDPEACNPCMNTTKLLTFKFTCSVPYRMVFCQAVVDLEASDISENIFNGFLVKNWIQNMYNTCI